MNKSQHHKFCRVWNSTNGEKVRWRDLGMKIIKKEYDTLII